ncbi:hypothetical protein A9Q81_21900 [Gammaproteobacteria bacterium 42_54_T18]|nr:hypothetical protein A9Q81_21900 [Gammaproteobacteria bacterium 42_54_T18]
MDNKWVDQLSAIKRLRKDAYRLDSKIIIMLAAGVVLSGISPGLAWIGGVPAFFLFYRKVVKSAHAPCPRCKEPFGVAQKWPLGVGGDECQNCGLELKLAESDSESDGGP